MKNDKKHDIPNITDNIIKIATTACGNNMFEKLVALLKSIALFSRGPLNLFILTDVLKERLIEEVFSFDFILLMLKSVYIHSIPLIENTFIVNIRL